MIVSLLATLVVVVIRAGILGAMSLLLIGNLISNTAIVILSLSVSPVDERYDWIVEEGERGPVVSGSQGVQGDQQARGQGRTAARTC
jgi:hypothetical protein